MTRDRRQIQHKTMHHKDTETRTCACNKLRGISTSRWAHLTTFNIPWEQSRNDKANQGADEIMKKKNTKVESSRIPTSCFKNRVSLWCWQSTKECTSLERKRQNIFWWTSAKRKPLCSGILSNCIVNPSWLRELLRD